MPDLALRAGGGGFWPGTRRLVFAVLGALVAASLAWLPATRRWSARAHLCWSSTIFLFVAYLAFVLDWTFASRLGAVSTAGGVLLWVFEVFAALLSSAYLWEICDALGTQHRRRRITAAPARPAGANCRSSACTCRPTTSHPTWCWTRSARWCGWTTRATRSW